MRSQNSYYKLIREKLDKAKTSAVNGFQGLALAHSNERENMSINWRRILILIFNYLWIKITLIRLIFINSYNTHFSLLYFYFIYISLLYTKMLHKIYHFWF